MSPHTEEFTIGVEEEYQIIDPETRQLCAKAQIILPAAQAALGEKVIKHEFRQSQLEIATPICRSLQEVRSHLSTLRSEVIAVAAKGNLQIAAAGTHPFSHWQEQSLTPLHNYQTLAQRYQILMHELVTFGCHVHIGLSDREMAVRVMNRARVWLAPLLALTVSSPFWLGRDTGYASYRSVLISRLPMTGAPLLFESYSDYQATVNALVSTKTIQDATQICWDLRISERYPTLEFRVTDMCMTVDEAVMIAGLARGIIRACYEQALVDAPYKAVRPELLRAAHWCAARSGLDSELIDVDKEQSVLAHDVIEKLLIFVHPALDGFGEWEEVSSLVRKIMQHGSGAARQRAAYDCTGSLESVVDLVIRETAIGLASPSGW